jgi:hypothetical protein
MAVHHTVNTGKHVFRIVDSRWQLAGEYVGYEVEMRPINQKTGKPWQSTRRVYDLATITPDRFSVPIAYATIEDALAAIARKVSKAK